MSLAYGMDRRMDAGKDDTEEKLQKQPKKQGIPCKDSRMNA
jgi:hypothetical protein